MKSNHFVTLAVLSLVSTTLACAVVDQMVATPTPVPTFTPQPTSTPVPTLTPTTVLHETEMSLEYFRTAFDSDGQNVTTVFGPGDVFYAVADLSFAPAGTIVETKWIVVDIEGIDPGEVIYEQTMNDFTDESFTGTIYFELSNEDGWPAGEYKVDIYLNSAFVDSAVFSVR